MGVSEYFYGSSLGALRSEDPSLENSVHYHSPQLIDTCLDGAILNGDGFITNISTTCSCKSYSELSGSLYSAQLMSEMKKMDQTSISMAVLIDQIDNSSIELTHILTGTHACGNFGLAKGRFPVCKTNLTDHRKADIMMEYFILMV